MTNWLARNKKSVIRVAFLVPIFLVAAISISHVVSWYDLANPISWAIYLSIAIEVAAMSAIAASSVKVKGFSVWFVFIIVTLIQFIGNIFFSYTEIDEASKEFKNWSELSAPVFEMMGSDVTDIVSQKRWLALLEGGLLPLISLTCLHFFIKYGEIDAVEAAPKPLEKEVLSEVSIESPILEEPQEETLESVQEEDSSPAPISEEIAESVIPTPVANGESKGREIVKKAPGISSKMKKIINRK